MAEIDLLKNYPKSKRKLDERAAKKTVSIRSVARLFGKEYFDGPRDYGYGGYQYNSRFWQPVLPDFVKKYHLGSRSSILDVGCGKGFMLYDFSKLIPGITLMGLDVSPYALEHAMEEMKPHLVLGNARNLPFASKSFDLVISINTIHNLPPEECKTALKEIMRVTKKDAFVTVDAFRNGEEKKRMDDWNLTALTYMSAHEWKQFFREAGYRGDYYWFIP